MGTSKILIDGVGIDLTGDTVAANKMLSGTKAHDSNGDSVTGSIQTYTGTQASGVKSITANGTYDVTEYASAAVNVQPEHYREYSGHIPSAVSGSGAYVTLCTDPILSQIAQLDSLFVRAEHDVAGGTRYAIKSCSAANIDFAASTVSGRKQCPYRFDTNGAASIIACTDKLFENSTVVGSLCIVGNELRWMVNSTSYRMYEGSYRVRIMW